MKHLSIKLFVLSIICLNFISLIDLETIQASTENSLIITEIGAYETSENEWIEVFNNSDTEIDLNTVFFIENNIRHKTTLIQGSNILNPKEYAVIANNATSFNLKYPEYSNYTVLDSSWASLSENGEALNLEFNGIIGQEFTYPATSKGKSLERIYSDSNYSNDWQPCFNIHSLFQNSSVLVTEEPNESENEENQPDEEIENPNNDEENQETGDNPDTSESEINTTVINLAQKIFISEVSFKDTQKDWIELIIFAPLDENKNYYLKIDSSKTEIILNTNSQYPQYYIVEKDLVGTTEQIILFENNKIIDGVCWENTAPPESEQNEKVLLFTEFSKITSCHDSDKIITNSSLARQNINEFLLDSNSYTNLIHPTKNQANVIQNQSPSSIITIQSGKLISDSKINLNLTGENSTDPDLDLLSYSWDFGNGETSIKSNPDTVTFDKIGSYPVTLTVTDSLNSSSKTTIFVNLTEKPNNSCPSNQSNNSTSKTAQSTTENLNSFKKDPNIYKLIVKDFMANPEGTDTSSEFITIFNPTETNINLENLFLDDSEDGSKSFKIHAKILKPNEEIQFFNSETKISLNNSNDSARLLDYDQKLIHEISYEKTEEGISYIELQTNGDTPTNETKNSKNPDAKSTTSNKTVSGFKNSQLRITEILPNPKGADTGNEWIEIYNPTNTNTPLINWNLQIGNKKFTFTDEIAQANSYTQIFITKHSLPNQNSKLILINHLNEITDEINYPKSEEGKSYSLIGNEFVWTDSLTPGTTNPKIVTVSGIIQEINQSSQTIKLLTNKNKNLQILYKNLPLLKINQKATIEAIELDGKLILNKIINESVINTKKQNNSLPALPIALTTISVSILAAFRHKFTPILKHFNL